VSSRAAGQHKRAARKASDAPAGDPATRERICEAALRLILRGGGMGVSLGAVARAARVSRQALYLHFANRADLFTAVVGHADDRRGLPDAIVRMQEATSGTEAVKLFIETQASLCPSLWPLARLFESVRREDAAAERSWQDRMSHRLEGCRALVARLEHEGALRSGLSREVAAEWLWTLTSIRTWEDLVLIRGWTARQYQERLTDLVLNSLVGPPR
jgi:AcrR family transcriptional regulator